MFDIQKFEIFKQENVSAPTSDWSAKSQPILRFLGKLYIVAFIMAINIMHNNIQTKTEPPRP